MKINIKIAGIALLILVVINLLIFTSYFDGKRKAAINNKYMGKGVLIGYEHDVINDGTSLVKGLSSTSLTQTKTGRFRQPSDNTTQLIDGNLHLTTLNQLKRKERLRTSCQSSVADDNFKLYPINYRDHIFVLDRLKVVFCLVPKAGSTNWKKVLLKLNGNYSLVKRYKTIHGNPLLRTLKTYADVDIEKILSQYTKVVIVRHPFIRILSAYKDKLEREDKQFEFRTRLIPIIKRYRKRGEQSLSDTVTFQEFVRYLTDPAVFFKHAAEEHWREMYRMCAPCKIRYDIIGKMETINEDAGMILKSIGTDVQFPSPRFSTNASSELAQYYRTLSSDELNALRQRYLFDFNLFDYKQELPTLNGAP